MLRFFLGAQYPLLLFSHENTLPKPVASGFSVNYFLNGATFLARQLTFLTLSSCYNSSYLYSFYVAEFFIVFSEPPRKVIKFRNYAPKDEDLKTKKLEKIKPSDGEFCHTSICFSYLINIL